MHQQMECFGDKLHIQKQTYGNYAKKWCHYVLLISRVITKAISELGDKTLKMKIEKLNS
jgi:hypothetical protein